MYDPKQFMTREELHQALDEFKQARQALNRPFKFPPFYIRHKWAMGFLLALGGISIIYTLEDLALRLTK
jgi:hypothetical protein